MVRAVDDVSFAVRRGELVGLVGESGSGKSTVGRSIVGLERPQSGAVRLDGIRLQALRTRGEGAARTAIQYVFQDPAASLDPRMRVDRLVGEGLRVRSIGTKADRQQRIADVLHQVGLPAASMRRLPHEFSGGQRQRISIARALAVAPDFLIADEPISGLDLSVQAQILNLLADLRDDLGLGMLLIAHDLPAVEHLCDRIIVLYLGRIMEMAPAVEFFRRPMHPYARALLAAVPSMARMRSADAAGVRGEVPSPMAPPSGCVFRTRCIHAVAACAEQVPPSVQVAADHHVACLRIEHLG